MATFNYRVVFESNMEGKVLEKAQKEMIRGQNRLAELTDGVMKTWNEIFDRDHPDYDEDREDTDSEYMKFMVDKHTRLVNLYMNNEHFSKLIRYEIGENCNLEGVLWKDPSKRISFHLEPIG